MISAEFAPVIPGFHPDPTICRQGDDYYVAHSSFEYSPGIPIWHSTDLTSWTLIGNALDRDEQFPAGRAGSSEGLFAPTLRVHEGTFWLIVTDVSGSGGQVVFHAEHPAGPWSAPTLLRELRGIDPDLAWDADGTCYVTYCSSDPALVGIAQARVDLATGEVLESPRSMWSGIGLAYPEAPHLYRRGTWWYLLIAEGGTERGHAVSIARAESPEGPFEGAPANPILSHRSSTHPVQNTGHADLIERPDGSWAAVYLAVRPSGYTPMFHVNGRETFLAGVDWVDDWPVIREAAFSFEPSSASFRDDFTGDALHPRWVSPGSRPSSFASTGASGLTVRPDRAASGIDSLVAVRTSAPAWQAAVRSDGPGVALRVRLDEAHWFEARRTGSAVEAWMRIGPLESLVGTVEAGSDTEVEIEVGATAATFSGPDDLVAVAVIDGVRHPVARVDGRYLSTEVAAGFTGRVVGVRAIDGPVTVRRFDYREGADIRADVPA